MKVNWQMKSFPFVQPPWSAYFYIVRTALKVSKGGVES